MFLSMFQFEWRYFIRQPSFFVTCAIFFLLTFFATVSDNVQIGGGSNVAYNGPFSIAQTLLILSIFSMFLVVNFVANTAIRNDATKMAELLYSKPMNALSYQLGRFLGSFAIILTVFAFAPLGIFLGSFIGGLAGWVDPERLVAHSFDHYFSTFIYLNVPTLFVLSCFFYGLAMRFRSMMAVYLSAVGLFMLYSVSGDFLSEPEYRTIVGLTDPFGLRAFGEVSRYWTAFEKNTSSISLEGILMYNRLIWISVGIFCLFVLGRLSHLSLASKKQKIKKGNAEELSSKALKQKRYDYESGSQINHWGQLSYRIGFEIKQVIFSAPFIILALLTLFMLSASLLDPQGIYGTPTWPLTQSMVELIQDTTSLLMLIVLVYYSGEIVWRDRTSGMGDIIDSMPVHNVTFWLSKVITLSLLLVLLFVFASLITIINQLVRGYFWIDISQYVLALGYITFLPLFFSTILAFFFQVISPNKYVGMLIFTLFIILSLVMGEMGFSHQLFHFGQAPLSPYSDLNGYGDFLTAHHWFMIYWLGAAIVIATLTFGLWHRGPSKSLKERIQLLNYYLGAPGKSIAAGGLCLFIGTGVYIYYNTLVLNEHLEKDPREKRMADYEKNYVQYQDALIPTITKVFANVDIYPKERKIIASADIAFVNKGNKPINRFMMHKPSHTSEWSVDFEGGQLQDFNDEFEFSWFEFNQPLQVGETRSGKISVVREHQGFKVSGHDLSVLKNGTFINNISLFSRFGYSPDVELQDRLTRKKYGLEPQERAHKLEDEQYYSEHFFGKGTDLIDFEAVVTTDSDQFAIAPGYLQSEHEENGRRRFHYKMDSPMVNFYSILSANLEAKKVDHDGIAIEVYYHKTHSMNVDRMIESVKDSIDYFSEQFGPYQHQQLRIIEFPGYRNFAQSFANTVPYSEKIGFISDLRDPDDIDPAYYVTAHEVAHQWWGHQVAAANVQGSAIISESLSQYSALMVMEKKYGKQKLRKFLQYELDKYLRGRSSELLEEMPLMRSEDQQYIHYRKGSVVMMAIRDRLGEKAMNQALSSFLETYKFESSPYPTTLDLLSYLKKGASEENQRYIDDQFRHITLYDIALKKVTFSDEKDSNGNYTVTLEINAAKKRADGKGREEEVDLEQTLDIGLFASHPETLSDQSTPLYFDKHRIVSGENIIKVKVKEKPKYAGVDPFIKLIDKDAEDNIRKL